MHEEGWTLDIPDQVATIYLECNWLKIRKRIGNNVRCIEHVRYVGGFLMRSQMPSGNLFIGISAWAAM